MTDHTRLDEAADAPNDSHQTVDDHLPPGPNGDEPGPADLPAVVGRYVVGPELKQGGMGRIIRVWDEEFKRPLALKLVRDRDSRMEQRLVHEGRLTGCLQHPGIPPVHDQGLLPDGRPYFIMKLIQGSSLSQRLRQRTSPAAELPDFLLIFEQLCEAVGYAHSRQVLHRDLKPGNVMVGAFGEVQLIDWGLSKMMRPAAVQGPASPEDDEPATVYGLRQTTATVVSDTTAGTALGTPAYMAPEQARGELNILDARADVFGLGAILCDLLTGGPPYRGQDKHAVYEKARRADLAEAWERLAGCGADAELTALARACLATHRQERPADGAAVAERVAAYRQEVRRRLQAAEVEAATAAARAEEEKKLRVAESARVEEEVRRRREEHKRRRVTVALALALLLLVSGAGGAALWYQQEQAEQREQEAERQTVQAQLAAKERTRKAALKLQREYLNKEGTAALDGVERSQREFQQKMADPKAGLLSNLDEGQKLLNDARADWKRAQTLADGSPLLLDETVRDRLQRLSNQLLAEETQFTVVRKLDTIRLEASTLVKGKWNPAAAGLRYAAVFRKELDLDLKNGEIDLLVHQVKQSPIRLALVAALDHWAQVTFDRKLLPRLLEVARRADPDVWSDQVRDVKTWDDPKKLQDLARKCQPQQHSPQFLNLLAERLWWTNSREESAALSRAALLYYPQDFWLHFNLGDTLKDPTERVGCYRAALALRPKNPVAHHNLGCALSEKKDLKGAIAHIRKALEFDDGCAPFHYNLGIVLHANQDLEGAIKHYLKAINIDPKFADAYHNLGLTLRDKGEREEANKCFLKAKGLDPGMAMAHYNLGYDQYVKKDLKGAIALYQESIKLDPKYANAHHALGIALGDRGDVEGAIEHFRIATELEPKHAPAHHGWGVALRNKGDREEAIKRFRKAIEIDDNFAMAHHGLGAALLDKGDREGAIKEFRRAIALGFKDTYAHNGLGTALAGKGDLDGAIKEYLKAIELDSKLAKNYHDLGIALHRKKDLDGAIARYRQAIALDPIFPTHGALGMALLEKGQYAEARAALRDCLKLLPKGHPAQNYVQQQLQRTESILVMEGNLSSFLEKGRVPDQPQELVNLIDWCRTNKHYHAAAAKLYQHAFSAHPAWADDMNRGLRYQAACSAALAAADQGKDPDKLTAEDKTKLRAQALTWLQADLQQWSKLFQARDLKALPGLLTRLPAWPQEAAFAPFRDTKEQAKVPADEQKEWARLWADVDQLAKQSAAHIRTERFTGALTAQEKERAHEIKLQAGQTCVIDLESPQFDTLLRLHDQKGKLLAENDDIVPGVNLNSRLYFTAPADGTFRLMATSFEQRGVGAYTLTVRSFVEANQ
jgi:tetratricopeptide (TPR) repeat protein